MPAVLSHTGKPPQTPGPTKPDCVLDAILATTRTTGYPVDSEPIINGLRALLRLSAQKAANASPALADYLISLIDDKISGQVNAILHHPDFLALESTWRGLRFLTDRLDFSQNIRLEYINISKDDLLRDFQDSPEVVTSGLYRHTYTAEFGQFGGVPVTAIIADYIFTPSPQDIQLLHYVASVAAMAHAPLKRTY